MTFICGEDIHTYIYIYIPNNIIYSTTYCHDIFILGESLEEPRKNICFMSIVFCEQIELLKNQSINGLVEGNIYRKPPFHGLYTQIKVKTQRSLVN